MVLGDYRGDELIITHGGGVFQHEPLFRTEGPSVCEAVIPVFSLIGLECAVAGGCILWSPAGLLCAGLVDGELAWYAYELDTVSWLAQCGGSVDGELAWCAGKLDTVSWLGQWTVSWPGVLASWTRSVGWAVVGLGELGWWK
ncbi:hypothetical protein TIFTF001_042744 [Ficus carica]|uniref:Uncharacterized protein n=1 Tax=Ficus carica TaxID=3494 RepID=A0AA88A2L7_FICCA|nr:hypothetical protein TIFTF001_042734 [Ficus carica]GMN38019.1 hypothetical protein TIFTF001_042738 [Ficus carica]GMN38033.1 hypothetical protein TIFTF001_042740 [Ficus carica]GMN38044.1 hypothetical protein TIFTF001_042744 [Ficus carica]